MATYLKGVTDYIPQIQPWSPDYNFYQNALERKQRSYDRGWEQTNTIYNSILNAPMMREQNLERRDNFFREIEGQIQQMSTVDLSLQQNVDAAASVFKPFYENEDIVHDIAYTKKYQDQIQHADYLKNCTDKEKCGGKYWPGGKRLLNYKAQEFINATDEEALRMQAPSYTNYVNFMSKAEQAINEAGKGQWEMVTDRVEGGYKIRTKNGKQIIGTLKNFMMARFGDDPEINEFYHAKAELMSYEEPEKLINAYEIEMLRSEANTQEELEALIKERAERKKFDTSVEIIDKKTQEEKSGLEAMVERQAILDGIITSNGVLPNSKEAKQYKELQSEIPIKEEAVKKAEQTSAYVRNMQYIDEDGNKIPTSVINSVVAQAMLMGDIDRTAGILAYRNFSETREADAYSLANYNYRLDVAKADRAAERTDVNSTIKYIRDRGAAENATRSEKRRRNLIDKLTIGDGLTHEDRTYKGLTNAEALSVYIKLFAGKNNTGNPYYDGAVAGTAGAVEGTIVKEGSEVDKALKTAVERAKNNEEVEDGDNLVNVIDTKNSRMYNDAFTNYRNYEEKASDFTNRKLKFLVQTVLDPKAADRKIASEGVLLIGDMIKEAKDNNDPVYRDLKKSGIWDKYFESFPNSTTRYSEGTSFAQVNNDNAYHYISQLVGNDKIIDLFNNKDIPITVRDEKDPSLIDTEALGIISHEEAKNLTEMRNQLIADGYLPESALSESQQESLDKYNQTVGNVRKQDSENYLHSLMSDADRQQLTYIAWYKENAKGMLNSLNFDMDEHARVFGEKVDGEKDNVMATFIRKNIIQKPTPEIRMMSNRQDLYKLAAGEGVRLLSNYKKDNLTMGIQPSIAQLENDPDYFIKNEEGYPIPLTLEGEALQGVLSTADMPVSVSAIDIEKLYKEYNIPLTIKKPQYSRTGNLSFTEEPNIKPAWSTLVNDPQTQIVREGENIAIRSPYLKTPGNGLLLNTNDVEVNEGVQDMFNDINDNHARVMGAFGDLIQASPDHPNYLVYGTGGDFQGPLEGNYNVTSKSRKNIEVAPFSDEEERIPAFNDYVQLIEEAQANLGKIDFTEYGYETNQDGDATFINMVTKALKDTYKDDKNMPIFEIDYTPVAGADDLTKVTIRLNQYKAQDWLKSIGQEVTGISVEKQVDAGKIASILDPTLGLISGTLKGSKMKTKDTYYIKDSKSAIIQKSKPDVFMNVLANLPVNSTFVDSTQQAQYGGLVRYTRASREKISAQLEYPEYNWENNTTYTRKQTYDNIPLIGTDWEYTVKTLNGELRRKHKELESDYREFGALITDPSKLK